MGYMYKVKEVFDSIQGEGCMIGMPVTFIRLQGCNLACPWCDSKETWGQQTYTEYSAEQLAMMVNQETVVITGGEPTIQDLTELVDELHRWQKIVCIETNGTNPTYEGIDWVVASPKPGKDYYLNPECKWNELKYVVSKEFNMSAIPNVGEARGQIWLQPCDYGDDVEANKASIKKVIELVMTYPQLRAGIQLHKVLEVK